MTEDQLNPERLRAVLESMTQEQRDMLVEVFSLGAKPCPVSQASALQLLEALENSLCSPG